MAGVGMVGVGTVGGAGPGATGTSGPGTEIMAGVGAWPGAKKDSVSGGRAERPRKDCRVCPCRDSRQHGEQSQ